MTQHKPIISTRKVTARAQPGQDIIVRKQASQFPEVGMTLSSYKHSAIGGAAPARRPLPPNIPSRQASTPPKSRRRFIPKISLRRVAIFMVLAILLTVGWLGFKFIYNAHKVFGGNIFSVLSTTKLKGESTGRVNILLAGNSSDDTGHDGAQLTDSIMILSIDVKNNKAFMLSIPRDLYVDIGDNGHAKINAAYVYGEQNNFSEPGYASGGMGQLEQVIQQNLGINIDYYALVDYSAFRDAVNAVGGIDVTIASSDPRGLYDPSIDWTTHGPLVKLTNGVHHLNGQQALDLARARGDDYRSYGFAGSDFDRTEHQRQMLVALKAKAVSAGTISNPAKLSSLSDAIGSNVKTDLKLSEVHRLYDLVKNINGGAIQSLSLNKAYGKNLLSNYTSLDGQSTLIPAAGLDNFTDIQAFLQRAMSSDPLVQEGATIVVLNATDTSGIASAERTNLEAKNLQVLAAGNALSTQAVTSIIDNSGGSKPATRAYLAKTYGNNFTTANPYADTYNADFIILVGNDKIPKPSTTTQ
jgi:LCP family protein required for cell wall assembly